MTYPFYKPSAIISRNANPHTSPTIIKSTSGRVKCALEARKARPALEMEEALSLGRTLTEARFLNLWGLSALVCVERKMYLLFIQRCTNIIRGSVRLLNPKILILNFILLNLKISEIFLEFSQVHLNKQYY